MREPKISQEVAATVLLTRRQRRNSFLEFSRYLNPDGEPARHHKLIIEKLQEVADGKNKRLALFMPPGHAKTRYASVLFPIWYLGNNKSKFVIAASHTSEMAEDFGRKCRTLLYTPEYRHVFQFGLDDKNKAAGHWILQNGGEYFAIGVGGAVTGRRSDVAIIDDPIRGQEDADSEIVRKRTWDWYLSDFRTRMKPNAALILIQTRWNEDDLAGRIFGPTYMGESGQIQAVDGEWWEVLCLPALAERSDDPLGRAVGEPLWPDYYTLELLEQERRSLTAQGPRKWAALYQQRPAPEEGNFFKREWIKYYTKKPANLRIYGASDYAVTSKGGDYTVHLVVGLDEHDDLYILDLWRGQTESIVWVEEFLNFIQRYKPLEWGEENGQILKSLDPIIQKRMRERKIYAFRKQYSSTTDKVTRSQAIQARMAMGKVFFPQNATWMSTLEHEILTFPAGKHDDMVDCLSLLGRMLSRMVRANRPREQKVNKTLQAVTYDELWASQKRRLGRGRI